VDSQATTGHGRSRILPMMGFNEEFARDARYLIVHQARTAVDQWLFRLLFQSLRGLTAKDRRPNRTDSIDVVRQMRAPGCDPITPRNSSPRSRSWQLDKFENE
jgi:hypothetical protein